MKKFVSKLVSLVSTILVLAIVFFILINLLLPLKYDRVDGCNGEKTLVTEQDGQYIYTLCMDNIKVRNWFNEVPFEEYISKNKDWYKKIKPILTFPSTQDEYALNMESINYKVLECNTKKNKNIYIMPLYTTTMSIDCENEEIPLKVENSTSVDETTNSNNTVSNNNNTVTNNDNENNNDQKDVLLDE